MEKKLYRDEFRKKVAGVCAGLSDYFGVDASIIRIIFILTTIFHGTGAVIYIVLWVVLPTKSIFLYNPYTDQQTPGNEPPPTFSDRHQPNFTMPNYPPPSSGTYPPSRKSAPKIGIISGVILIILGGIILLNNLNLIPDIDFNILWPMVLITIGLVFIATSAKKQPWENPDWHKTDAQNAEPVNNDENNSATTENDIKS